MDEIFKGIYDSSKKHSLITEDFERNAINEMIKEKQLQDYVTKITFSDGSKKKAFDFSEGSFNRFTGELIMYMGQTIKLYDIFPDDEVKGYSEFETYMIKNFLLFVVFSHELHHAKELKICFSDSNSIEARILREIYFFDLVKRVRKELDVNPNMLFNDILKKVATESEIEKLSDILYHNTRLLNPAERMAWITSSLELIKLYNDMRLNNKNIEAYLKRNLKKWLISGYSFMRTFSSPTKECFREYKISDSIKGIPEFDFDLSKVVNKKVVSEYSLEERFFMGMPVYCDEFELVDKLIDSKFKRRLFLPKN